MVHTYTHTYINRGLCLLEMQRYSQAATHFMLAIKHQKQPESLMYVNLGRAYQELGQLEAAMTEYDRALRLVCVYVYVCMHLCACVCVCVCVCVAYQELGQLEAAMTEYDRALRLVCVYACMYACMYVCMYVQVYILPIRNLASWRLL